MAFSPLGDYLSKFKNLTLPNETIRKITRETILEVSKVDVPFDKLSFRNGVVYLNIVGLPKNEIYLYKLKILEEVEKKLSKRTVVDIR
ncbi:MAG TPA: hypothetical protein VJJ24_03295 [Candidatus Paceibacterota bacterium]